MHGRLNDEKRQRADVFEILFPDADEPSVRDKAKVNIDQTNKTHIWNLMPGLAQIITNFTNLNAVILADYFENDVSSALYQ